MLKTAFHHLGYAFSAQSVRLLVSAIALAGCLSSSAAAEQIANYDATVKVLKDSTLDVTENITMDFGKAERHGIYRMIPVRYKRNNARYSVALKLLDVTDEKGAAYQYKVSDQDNDQCIKIGSGDYTVHGVHHYKLHYTVRRAINFFNGEPEIYWNVTGSEWPYPIEHATARLDLPPEISISPLKTQAYRGPFGSQELAEIDKSGGQLSFKANNLKAGEGLTMLARLPAGSIKKPSSMQELGFWLTDWWPLPAISFASFGVMMLLWWSGGRDPGGSLKAGVEWQPPKDLSPAEVGTLVDESCDMADIVSTVVDLAARGYLKIKEEVTHGFLWMNNKDYQFTRTDKSNADLKGYERLFLHALFEGSKETVMLSDLKERFYLNIPRIESDIYDTLASRQYFTKNPRDVRNTFKAVGSSCAVIGLVAVFIGLLIFPGSLLLPAGGGLLITSLIILVMAPLMPAKTPKGVQANRECLGFQRFVKMAEKERIRVLAKDDPTIFGRLLPYAMVLGAADQWADAFQDLLTEPPDWYQPADRNGMRYQYNPRSFISDLGSSTRSMGQTFASVPAPPPTESSGWTSAGSGSSGFSIGSGFSGGGFGGGGGGSW